MKRRSGDGGEGASGSETTGEEGAGTSTFLNRRSLVVLSGTGFSLISLVTLGAFSLRQPQWLYLVLPPRSGDIVSYHAKVVDESGAPVPGVAVLSRSGQVLGVSATDGKAEFRDSFLGSAWYFKPQIDLGGHDRSGLLEHLDTPVTVLGGAWVEPDRQQRLDWLRYPDRAIIQLRSMGSGAAAGSQYAVAQQSRADRHGEGPGAPPNWPQASETTLLERHLFTETDLAEATDSQANQQALVQPGATVGADPASIVGVDATSAQGRDPQSREGGSDGLATAATGDEPQRVVAPVAHPPSSVGELRTKEFTMNSSPGSDQDAAAQFNMDPLGGKGPTGPTGALYGRAGAPEADDIDVPASSAALASAPQLPSALDHMREWKLPDRLFRDIYLAVKGASSSMGEADGLCGLAARVFGVSSTKGIELALGEVACSGRLAVRVPESLRLDVVRVEHPGCGGIVVPLLASTETAPQNIACAVSERQEQLFSTTIGVMYEAHGLQRYFNGGHLEADGAVGDVAGKVSLFRIPVQLALRDTLSLRFRHPEVAGGVQSLTREVEAVAALLPAPLSAAVADYVSRPRPPAHRTFLASPEEVVRPRVTIRLAQGSGPYARRVDRSLVQRFERSMQASFVNAKSFVPVPWSSVERLTGISWQLALDGEGGWQGTVLDYHLDYVLSIVPGSEGVTATWFDRQGNALSRRTHAYLDGVPPELLARDVFDVAIENMPQGAVTKTATR